jgi:microcystin-dependent protein
MTISTGTIIPYGGSSAPSGFLLCDGSAVSRTTYATLFGVIGTTFGSGDGSTTFNVPDLRGRVPAGKDNMGGSAASRLTSTTMTPDGNTLGASGGEQTHTLTIAELASHGHDVRGTTNGIYNTTVGLKDNNCINIQGDDNANGGTSGLVTNNSASNPYVGSTGSGTAHNNVQPTLIVNYIIATQDTSGAGTVTSVAMTGDGVIFNSTVSGSPVTTSGTLAPALLTQTANTVLAGPSSGAAAAPTFRALVQGDIPALNVTQMAYPDYISYTFFGGV